jgi:tetratricopeptide (TPR) repeat protein
VEEVNKAEAVDTSACARILNEAGLPLKSKANYKEAEPLFRRALATYEQSLGPNHPSVAASLNNLAVLLKATSRLSEAEPLFRRAVGIVESSLGPDHPYTLTFRKNLELFLAKQGKAKS